MTPSPAVSRLKEVTGETPPSFQSFTYTHESVLDGERYKVSFSEDEFDEAYDSDAGTSIASKATDDE